MAFVLQNSMHVTSKVVHLHLLVVHGISLRQVHLVSVNNPMGVNKMSVRVNSLTVAVNPSS